MIGHSYTFLEPSQVSEEHLVKLSCNNGRMVCIIKVSSVQISLYTQSDKRSRKPQGLYSLCKTQ